MVRRASPKTHRTNRIAFGLSLIQRGHALEEAALLAQVNPERLRMALGEKLDNKRLEERMTDTTKIRRLVDRVEHEAREHNIDTRHAAGLVWMEEGGERNSHSPRAWADVMTRLQARSLSEGAADSSGSDAQEQAIAERAEELAAQDRNQPYRQAALAEMIDRGELPLWEEAPAPQPNERQQGLAEIRRQQLARQLGQAPADPYVVKVRQHASEKGLSVAEAEQQMFDKGLVK